MRIKEKDAAPSMGSLCDFRTICCSHLFQNNWGRRDLVDRGLASVGLPAPRGCFAWWEFGCFSAIRGRSEFIVNTEREREQQQIRLLPVSSTDRLRARAPGQHNQSIRSCPQTPTLIGGRLPKGGKEA